MSRLHWLSSLIWNNYASDFYSAFCRTKSVSSVTKQIQNQFGTVVLLLCPHLHTVYTTLWKHIICLLQLLESYFILNFFKVTNSIATTRTKNTVEHESMSQSQWLCTMWSLDSRPTHYWHYFWDTEFVRRQILHLPILQQWWFYSNTHLNLIVETPGHSLPVFEGHWSRPQFWLWAAGVVLNELPLPQKNHTAYRSTHRAGSQRGP